MNFSTIQEFKKHFKLKIPITFLQTPMNTPSSKKVLFDLLSRHGVFNCTPPYTVSPQFSSLFCQSQQEKRVLDVTGRIV
jgi:hypothetical protein